MSDLRLALSKGLHPAAVTGGSAADRDSDSQYALALAASHRGDPNALEMLNTALDAFLLRKDTIGAALASASLLVTGQLVSNYRRFPDHIAWKR